MTAVATELPAEVDLRAQPGIAGLEDVVVAQVAVQAVGQERVAVIQRRHQICDQAGHAT